MTYLLIATGGCGRVKESDNRVYLQPRNKEMHQKKWNKKNVLETSLTIGARSPNRLEISIMNDNPSEEER